MVSVVVVNWNRKEFLRGCLASLLRQSSPPVEIIVVDNGSTDGSVRMMEQDFAGSQPPLRIIRNASNRGFCAANNQGIAIATGSLIALLNNDAEADPGWLGALAAPFAANPSLGMAASKILVYDDPSRIDKVGHLIYPDGQNRGRGSGEIDRGQYDHDPDAAWPDGCAAMYRAAMLQAIGAFDEDLFAYADDAELGLRARIAGWECVYVPDARVRHRRGATMGLRSAERLVLIERNRILLVLKLFPWSLITWNWAYWLARVAAGLRASARGVGETELYPGLGGKLRVAWALVRGHWGALLLAPRMLRKRADVRKIRKLSPAETRSLILRYRISLRELSESSTETSGAAR